MASAAKQINVS